VQVLKIRVLAWAARLIAGGVFQQRVDLDDIGTQSASCRTQIENGEAGKGLRGAWEGIEKPSLFWIPRYRGDRPRKTTGVPESGTPGDGSCRAQCKYGW
jgi:hypothetical protein